MKKFLWKLGWGILYYLGALIVMTIVVGVVMSMFPNNNAVAGIGVLIYAVVPFYVAAKMVKRRALKKNIDERFKSTAAPVATAKVVPHNEPKPVPVQTKQPEAPVVKPEPVKVEVKPEVKPEPVKVEVKTEIKPEPVKVEVKPEIKPEPVKVEVKPEIKPEPVKVEVKPEIKPEPVKAEVKPEIKPEPIKVEVKPEPQPVVKPVVVAEGPKLLNLNTATQEQLMKISGINLILSKRIIKLRENGDFTSLEQVIQELHLPEQTSREVRKCCCVETTQRIIDF